jgi:hypothetical protein
MEYDNVKTMYEQFGIILKDVKCLRCPIDGEELFTLEQAEAIRQRLVTLSPRLAHKQDHQSRRDTINIPPA